MVKHEDTLSIDQPAWWFYILASNDIKQQQPCDSITRYFRVYHHCHTRLVVSGFWLGQSAFCILVICVLYYDLPDLQHDITNKIFIYILLSVFTIGLKHEMNLITPHREKIRQRTCFHLFCCWIAGTVMFLIQLIATGYHFDIRLNWLASFHDNWLKVLSFVPG